MMKRRDFITLLGGAAAAWPGAARAQQRSLPVIGYLDSQSLEVSEEDRREFRQSLKDNGFVDGENVAIEFYFSGYQMERLPELLAELIRRPVAVIVARSGFHPLFWSVAWFAPVLASVAAVLAPPPPCRWLATPIQAPPHRLTISATITAAQRPAATSVTIRLRILSARWRTSASPAVHELAQ